MSGVELAVLAVASSAVSAYAGIQAAKAQKAQYDAQAALTEKKGRQEALAYKQKGVEVLKNMNKALAATTARAGAETTPALLKSMLSIRQTITGLQVERLFVLPRLPLLLRLV
jgi:uncharacterized membrane protein YqiK